MGLDELIMKDTELLAHYLPNAPQVMWFLGAGTSRTAGMPTAYDIIWNLKKSYYCREENLDINAQDLNINAIKSRIQNYMDSKGFPSLWSPEEYSFYFQLLFADDYEAQQKYLREILSPQKISLNVGHRVLAALLALGKAKLIFTTNFDSVIEEAYAYVAEKNLATFHLEGSYAALSELNNDNFPIYAKIHGDFRYQSIKNLSIDLQENDKKIQECFLAASTRFGMIVSGYSGRDSNVMNMFNEAIKQNNAFPFGLYWTVTNISSSIPVSVVELIQSARQQGIKSGVVDTGTFDTFLSKIWRQTPNRTKELDAKVWPLSTQKISIPLTPPANSGFPIIRTNALMITNATNSFAELSLAKPINHTDLKTCRKQYSGKIIATMTDKVWSWGAENDIKSCFQAFSLTKISKKTLENITELIRENTLIKAFFEEAIAYALVNGKPLSVRKKGGYYIIINKDQVGNSIFDDLKKSVQTNYHKKDLFWQINQSTSCCEALSIKLEEKNNILWLMLKPDIWVSPISEREKIRKEIDNIKRTRYNSQCYNILSSWISILLGEIKEKAITGNDICISYFNNTEFPVTFSINTRSAFSRPEAK